jgi:hypothetical protein
MGTRHGPIARCRSCLDWHYLQSAPPQALAQPCPVRRCHHARHDPRLRSDRLSGRTALIVGCQAASPSTSMDTTTTASPSPESDSLRGQRSSQSRLSRCDGGKRTLTPRSSKASGNRVKRRRLVGRHTVTGVGSKTRFGHLERAAAVRRCRVLSSARTRRWSKRTPARTSSRSWTRDNKRHSRRQHTRRPLPRTRGRHQSHLSRVGETSIENNEGAISLQQTAPGIWFRTTTAMLWVLDYRPCTKTRLSKDNPCGSDRASGSVRYAQGIVMRDNFHPRQTVQRSRAFSSQPQTWSSENQIGRGRRGWTSLGRRIR